LGYLVDARAGCLLTETVCEQLADANANQPIREPASFRQVDQVHE